MRRRNVFKSIFTLPFLACAARKRKKGHESLEIEIEAHKKIEEIYIDGELVPFKEVKIICNYKTGNFYLYSS